MKYQELIDLGFERTDYNSVLDSSDREREFLINGLKCGGYYLVFKLADNLYLETGWENLNKIELQIDGSYLIYVSDKQVRKLIKSYNLKKKKEKKYKEKYDEL